MVVGGYELDHVRHASQEARDRLNSIGLDENVLILPLLTKADFASSCNEAADRCAQEMSSAFHPLPEVQDFLRPAALGSERYKTELSGIRRVVFEKLSAKDLEEEQIAALEAKKAGAVLIMLSACDQLRREAAVVLGEPDCPDQILTQFDVFRRAYLNDELAKKHSAKARSLSGRIRKTKKCIQKATSNTASNKGLITTGF